MKFLYTLFANWFASINKYFYHYKKFGKGGIYLLQKIKNPSKELIQFSIKGLDHPLYLRNHSSDLPTFYQIFSFKQYRLKNKIQPRFIIDCGANVGYSSIYFSSVYPDATIIAVEPEISNFEMLVKNTASYKNIKCIQKGIWNKSTNLEIVDNGGGYWNFRTKEVAHKNNNTIKAISIDDIVTLYNIDSIDLLKIDIEGAEKELFEANYEHWLPLTKVMIVELHDRLKKGCSKSVFSAVVNYDFVLGHKGENLIFNFSH